MPGQSVRALMSMKVLCAPPEAPARELVALMHAHTYSCIVISDGDRPVGIVTERDLVGVLHQVLNGEPRNDVAASEFMSAPVLTIQEDRPVFEALVLCRSRHVRHLPVVDRNGGLVGLLTQSDLIGHHLRSIEAERARLDDPNAEAGDLIAANERLKALAHEDALLGVGNRRAMEIDLQYTHEASLRYATPYSIALCDVDYFKLYNDTYGHQAGDKVLIALAQLLHHNAPAGSLVARYGGEEFGVILPEHDRKQATAVAESLRAAVEATPIDIDTPSPLSITASMGVAVFDGLRFFQSPEQLVHAADQGIYAAKAAGRNKVRVFVPREPAPQSA